LEKHKMEEEHIPVTGIEHLDCLTGQHRGKQQTLQ
jgi:hypothetical protein